MIQKMSLVVLSAFTLVAAASCSSAGTNGLGTPSNAPVADGGTNHDDASTWDGGPGLGPAEGGTLQATRTGYVDVESSEYTLALSGYRSTLAQAQFMVVRGTPESAPCHTRIVSECEIEECPRSGEMGLVDFVSAGSLHLGLPGAPADWAPIGFSYAAQSAAELWWAGGESVTLRAEGDVVPAFTTSLVAPSSMVVNSPPFWTAEGLEVNATNPFTVTWSASASDDSVQVAIYEPQTVSTDAIGARCTFRAASAAGSIAPPVLSLFHKGDASIRVYSIAEARPTVDNWSLRTTLRRLAVTSTNAPGHGNLRFP